MLQYLHSHLKYRLLAYTIPLALLLGGFIYFAFLLVDKDSITGLARDFAIEKVRFNSGKMAWTILQEKHLAKLLSTSPGLIAWAMHENNRTLKHQAIGLLENHRIAFRDHNYFFVIDKSHHYYFNNKENTYADKQLRYTLSPDLPKDAWYYATRKRGNECQINVNNDQALKVTNVWINCLVHNGGNMVGMIGTGINLTEFIHTVVDTHQPGVTNMYINQDGAIQAAPDVKDIDFASVTHGVMVSKSVFHFFDRAEDRAAFSRLMDRVKHGVEHVGTITATIHGMPYVIGISGIKGIGWINVTAVDIDKLHIGRYFVPFALLFGLGMVLIFSLLIFLFNRLILSRIHRLDEHIGRVKSGDYSINGNDGTPDEIGRLTKNFFDMATTVRDHAVRLEKKVIERTADLEKSIREAEVDREQLDAVISHAMDGIIHINTQGIIQSFNPAAEKMFGYVKSEVIGQNIKILMPEPDHSQHDSYRQRYLKSGEADLIGKEREVTALRKNGETFPIALSASIMHIKNETYFLGIVRDITERKQTEDKIRKLALFDHLSGLPNRSMFMDRMQQAIAFAHRNKAGFSLFFLDLDNFKTINDTLGHEAGDHVLKLVAERLRLCMRKVDTVARLGGDEFTIILFDMIQRKQAVIMVDKIIAALGEPMMIDGKEYQYHIGVSIGIAAYPDDGDDVDMLIRCADTAMYAAKKVESHYVFYSDTKFTDA